MKTQFLIEFARALQPEYLAELRLILDYANCFEEQTELKRFLSRLQESLSPIVTETKFPTALRLILGDLLVKILTGENKDWSNLQNSLQALFKKK